eukprot:10788063-Karenia_brevis.AAC.1
MQQSSSDKESIAAHPSAPNSVSADGSTKVSGTRACEGRAPASSRRGGDASHFLCRLSSPPFH